MLVCYIYIQLKTFKIEKELDKMTCCNYLCRIVCSCEVTCIAQTSPQIQNIRWLVFMMCCDCYLCEIVCTYQAFSSDYCDHIQKERSSKSPRVWAPQWPGLATPCLQVQNYLLGRYAETPCVCSQMLTYVRPNCMLGR